LEKLVEKMIGKVYFVNSFRAFFVNLMLEA